MSGLADAMDAMLARKRRAEVRDRELGVIKVAAPVEPIEERTFEAAMGRMRSRIDKARAAERASASASANTDDVGQNPFYALAMGEEDGAAAQDAPDPSREQHIDLSDFNAAAPLPAEREHMLAQQPALVQQQAINQALAMPPMPAGPQAEPGAVPPPAEGATAAPPPGEQPPQAGMVPPAPEDMGAQMAGLPQMPPTPDAAAMGGQMPQMPDTELVAPDMGQQMPAVLPVEGTTEDDMAALGAALQSGDANTVRQMLQRMRAQPAPVPPEQLPDEAVEAPAMQAPQAPTMQVPLEPPAVHDPDEELALEQAPEPPGLPADPAISDSLLELHPVQLIGHLNQAFGSQWVGWDPETLEQTLLTHAGTDPDPHMLTMAFAIQVVLQNDRAETEPEAFRVIALGLNGDIPDDTEGEEHPSVGQLAFALHILQQFPGTQALSREVKGYIVAMLRLDGWCFAPEPFTSAEERREYMTRMGADLKLPPQPIVDDDFKSIQEILDEVTRAEGDFGADWREVAGKYYAVRGDAAAVQNLDDTNAVDAQVQLLLALDGYMELRESVLQPAQEAPDARPDVSA